jgi:hypothetical protein
MKTICSSNYPIGRWTLWRQDILLVSAFVVWAVVLGLLPVLVIGAIITTWAGHDDWETQTLKIQTAQKQPKTPSGRTTHLWKRFLRGEQLGDEAVGRPASV